MTAGRAEARGDFGLEELQMRFDAYLQARGLKVTHERELIFEEAMRFKKHFDADELYERFRDKGFRISRDTVYRNIPLLLESGVIQKSAGDSKREYFEPLRIKGHHDHLVCLQCGAMVEFFCGEFEALQEKISRQYGFDLVFHDHRLYGCCPKCK